MTIYVFKIPPCPEQQKIISAMRSTAIGCEVAECSNGVARITASTKDEVEAATLLLIVGASPYEVI